jgi:hypothetical protein
MSAAKSARVKCPQCRRHRSVARASRDGTRYQCFRCKLTFLAKAADAEPRRYDTVRLPAASAPPPGPAYSIAVPLQVVMDMPESTEKSPSRGEAGPSPVVDLPKPVVVVPVSAPAPAASPSRAAAVRPSIDLTAAVPVLGTGALLTAHAALMTQWLVPELSAWDRPLAAISLLLATAGLAAAHASRPRRAVRSAAFYLGVCILATLPAILFRPAAPRNAGARLAPTPTRSHTPGPDHSQRLDGAGPPPAAPL